MLRVAHRPRGRATARAVPLARHRRRARIRARPGGLPVSRASHGARRILPAARADPCRGVRTDAPDRARRARGTEAWRPAGPIRRRRRRTAERAAARGAARGQRGRRAHRIRRGHRAARSDVGMGGARMPRGGHRRDPHRAASGRGARRAHARAPPRRPAGGDRRARAGARRARRVRRGNSGPPSDRGDRRAARESDSGRRGCDRCSIRRNDRRRWRRGGGEPRGGCAPARVRPHRWPGLRGALSRSACDRRSGIRDPARGERPSARAFERRACRRRRALGGALGHPDAAARTGDPAFGRSGTRTRAPRHPCALADAG